MGCEFARASNSASVRKGNRRSRSQGWLEPHAVRERSQSAKRAQNPSVARSAERKLASGTGPRRTLVPSTYGPLGRLERSATAPAQNNRARRAPATLYKVFSRTAWSAPRSPAFAKRKRLAEARRAKADWRRLKRNRKRERVVRPKSVLGAPAPSPAWSAREVRCRRGAGAPSAQRSPSFTIRQRTCHIHIPLTKLGIPANGSAISACANARA